MRVFKRPVASHAANLLALLVFLAAPLASACSPPESALAPERSTQETVKTSPSSRNSSPQQRRRTGTRTVAARKTECRPAWVGNNKKSLEFRWQEHRSLAAQTKLPALSRLELCTEFTKPASLCIRLMGTPKNHRSPPA